MKLDATLVRYLSPDAFRLLNGIELGMKDHAEVPTSILPGLCKLRHGGLSKVLSTVHRHKLVHHENKVVDSYRLTTLGYDFLALKALVKLEIVSGIASQIGVGKEADVFKARCPRRLLDTSPENIAEAESIVGELLDQPEDELSDEDQEEHAVCVLKIHRLGRTSFRSVKNLRDYSNKKSNWLNMSRLSARREYTFLKVLHHQKFPVPIPLGYNRHMIAMEHLKGSLLNDIKKMEAERVEVLYLECMRLIKDIALTGLIHGDFNEFNLIIHGDKVQVIDFPQMISVNHENANDLFYRDVNCIKMFFARRFDYNSEEAPSLKEILSTLQTNQPNDNEVKKHKKLILQDEMEGKVLENIRIDLVLQASGWDNGSISYKSKGFRGERRKVVDVRYAVKREEKVGVVKGKKKRQYRMSRNVVKNREKRTTRQIILER
eukprot:augustus_masked-scaffold_9-processed-gene-2.8-mRNA-1 protein AED:0.09 eAED:0.09 QI:0/-1/0/1/-1/1/1/0/432